MDGKVKGKVESGVVSVVHIHIRFVKSINRRRIPRPILSQIGCYR